MTKEDLILDKLDDMGEELRTNREAHDRIGEQVTALRVDVEGLKVKSGIWGFIAGAIPALGALFMWFLGSGK